MWRPEEVATQEWYDVNAYDSFMKRHLQHYGYYTGRNEGYRHSLSTFEDWEKSNRFAESGDSSSESEYENKALKKEQGSKWDEFLKSTQLVYNYQAGKLVPKLREPRQLYAQSKELGPQQAARWPIEIQVLPERIKHIAYVPKSPELLYVRTGSEKSPYIRGQDAGGRVVYSYEPAAGPFFIRSRVGGYRGGCQEAQIRLESEEDSTLQFESRFESGNLAKAVQVGEYEYELWLRHDLYTDKHTQWYYFQVSNTKPNVNYRFTIVNFMKSDSLYNQGMRPLIYSEKMAEQKGVGWHRFASDINYYKNNVRYSTPKGDRFYYSLTWTCTLPHGQDTVFMAHCYPYTYTDLQDYLLNVINDPVKSKICKQRVLCRTLAGNLVYLLTITSPSNAPQDVRHKKAVVITSRVHPGETNASWMMKGFLDYLTGNSADAKLLRDSFIFKIVPMLNPDGVIVGNYRCSLAGRDLNRNYRTVLKESFPPVWYTKQMIRKLREEREVVVYCDLHGHSRKQNVFIYGCENKNNSDWRLRERIFPVMLGKNASDKFTFNGCKFKVQKSKEGTGRIVMWKLGVMNSYTMEATFCGSSLGRRKNQHFTTADFESLGYHFCDTLLDYSDPDPTKCANVMLELEDRLRREIMLKLVKQGETVSIDDVHLSDECISAGDSSDSGGSDSSGSDGLPVHLQYMTQKLDQKKKLKSRKDRDQRRAATSCGKSALPGDSGPSQSPHRNCKHSQTDAKGKHAMVHPPSLRSTLQYRQKSRSKINTHLASARRGSPSTLERAEYLETLTQAYLKSNEEPEGPHDDSKRSSKSGGSVVTTAASTKFSGEQLNLEVRPTQRHLLDLAIAQQRQQDFVQMETRKQVQDSEKRSISPIKLHQHPAPFDKSDHTGRALSSEPPVRRTSSSLSNESSTVAASRSNLAPGMIARTRARSANNVRYHSILNNGHSNHDNETNNSVLIGYQGNGVLPSSNYSNRRANSARIATPSGRQSKQRQSVTKATRADDKCTNGDIRGNGDVIDDSDTRTGLVDRVDAREQSESPELERGRAVSDELTDETDSDINQTLHTISELSSSVRESVKHLSPTTGEYIEDVVRRTEAEVSTITAELEGQLSRRTSTRPSVSSAFNDVIAGNGLQSPTKSLSLSSVIAGNGLQSPTKSLSLSSANHSRTHINSDVVTNGADVIGRDNKPLLCNTRHRGQNPEFFGGLYPENSSAEYTRTPTEHRCTDNEYNDSHHCDSNEVRQSASTDGLNEPSKSKTHDPEVNVVGPSMSHDVTKTDDVTDGDVTIIRKRQIPAKEVWDPSRRTLNPVPEETRRSGPKFFIGNKRNKSTTSVTDDVTSNPRPSTPVRHEARLARSRTDPNIKLSEAQVTLPAQRARVPSASEKKRLERHKILTHRASESCIRPQSKPQSRSPTSPSNQETTSPTKISLIISHRHTDDPFHRSKFQPLLKPSRPLIRYNRKS